jgi:predicted dienelactone hydrolase
MLMVRWVQLAGVTLLVACCAAVQPMHCAEAGAQTLPVPQKLQIAGLAVDAWIPDSQTRGRWPIVLFSHRYRGCNTQSSYLMQALAGAGYAVLAPKHRDADCGKLQSWLPRPEIPSSNPENWTEETYGDRAQDLENLLNALQEDPRFRAPPFDLQHVGLVGHSLGGYTVLELAGGWPHWKDPRVKAVIALSPYAAPFAVQHTLGQIDAPVMYLGGSRDIPITASLERREGAYEQTPAPKYLVVIDGAGHLAWVDNRATAKHPLTIEYGLAFFDRYLKGKRFPRGLEEPGPGVADLRFQE